MELNDKVRTPSQPRALIVIAFAAIYLIWGSTYLALGYAIQTLPPFTMSGARFIIAGVILYSVLRLATKAPVPERAQIRHGAIAGALLLGVGNGCVTWAQTRVPSNLAAVLVSVAPLWITLFDWARPGGRRPAGKILAGLTLGLAGVFLLVGGSGITGQFQALGLVAILISTVGWGLGSVYSARAQRPAEPLMRAALQMLAGGGLLLLLGRLCGEQIDGDLVTLRSVAAFSYLLVFGSLIAFSSYNWLLKVSTPTRVSTHSYVNPAVAVFLGWAIAGETVSGATVVATTLILGAIFLIHRAKAR